jgi:hypothetical protein
MDADLNSGAKAQTTHYTFPFGKLGVSAGYGHEEEILF